MGEVDLVVGLGEGVRPRQRVVAAVEAVTLALEAVLVVADVTADAVPAQLLGAVARHLRERQHAHPFVVKRIRLRQVKDVEFDGVALASVTDSEEEPLRVPVRVDIVLQH